MHKKHMYATRETNSSIYDVNMPVLLVIIIISTDAESVIMISGLLYCSLSQTSILRMPQGTQYNQDGSPNESI